MLMYAVILSGHWGCTKLQKAGLLTGQTHPGVVDWREVRGRQQRGERGVRERERAKRARGEREGKDEEEAIFFKKKTAYSS